MLDSAGDSAAGPLAGIKVVELAGIGPAPFCGMLLADLGAEVVRVDRPGGGGPLSLGKRDVLNRGRREVVVDLKHERGPEVVLRLAERADVLIEGFRPGVAERLGIGPRDCMARNPKLVYGRMTGWGQDGPLANSAGHDIGYTAIAGALHGFGRAGGPPQVPMNLVGDFGGGAMYLAVGVLSAVIQAGRTGHGQVVDAAIVDGTAHLSSLIFGMVAAGAWQDQRGVNLLDTGAPFYDVYETSDGGHMAVGALEPQFYAEFVRLLDAGDLPDRNDPANWPELRRRFTEVFACRTREEWTKIFGDSDACVAPVLGLTEAASHPHNAARGVFVSPGGVVQPAPAPRFSATPTPPVSAPSERGSHTRAVLSEWGLSDVDELIESGAAHQRTEG